MKSGKLITGMAVGAVIALMLVPKTRKMLTDAVCSISDSLKDLADKANNMAEKGFDEAGSLADKTRDIAGSVKKEAWQS